MNVRSHFSVAVFLAVWLLVSPGSARSPFAPPDGARFETPGEAARALDEAGALQARVDLLRRVARTYLRAHAYETLPTMISGLSVPENAAWQRTFLLANLQLILGNTEEAAHLLKPLPDSGLRDPLVLRFRIAHPELFGDDSLQAPPDLDSGTPEEAAKNYLDTLEPAKAWQVIAAHPGTFLDHLGALHPLTLQIADQNLAPKILPLLEERAKRQPESWELRLTLAQFQVLTGDNAGATETFRQVYTWRSDGASPVPTPTERVAALQGLGAYDMRNLNGAFVFSRVRCLENARDVALICLAKLADARQEGAAFIRALEEEYRGDETGWITALMLIDSPGLVIQELQASLAKGPPPGLADLAIPWLRASHQGRRGMDWAGDERMRLAAAFARLPADAARSGPGSSVSPGGDPAGLNEYVRLIKASKSDDPVVKEKFLAELMTSAGAPLNVNVLSTFVLQAAKQPEDAFFAQGAAILLAREVGEVDGGIASRAFYRIGGWEPLRLPKPGETGRNPLDRLRANRWPDPFEQPLPVNEQVEGLFLGQSTPEWSLLNARPGPISRTPLTLPPTLAPWLEKLAGDASSPLHVSARIAEAYLLHDVAGQEDHALDLLRQTIKESPSYVARFWLTAFLARRQQYQEAAGVFDGIKPVPGYFEAFLQHGRTLLQRADKGEPLLERARPAAPTPPARRSTTTASLLSDLQQILATKPDDPTASSRALAIATRLSTVLPYEVAFPGRETVLEAFARFGGLKEQLKQIEERAGAFPQSADAQLALGNAWALSSQPDAAARSTAAYRQAFQLAPDRADIAEKILGTSLPTREREDADCVLLRQGVEARHPERLNLSPLFKDPNSVARYIRAYGEGFRHRGHGSISGNSYFRDQVAAWRKAGQDDAVIDLLTAVDHSGPLESDYYNEPEKLLVDLLLEKGRLTEAAAVVDRILFPSEYLYGLDLGEGPAIPLLNSAAVLDFIRKVGTPAQMAAFEDHARRIMAEHPGGTRVPLALLTLLILDRSPTLLAELPGCLEALRTTQGDRLETDLSFLARMAAGVPETRPVALDLLAEVRRRQDGKPSELATVALLATTALDLGDRPRAEGALRELLAASKAERKSLDLRVWSDTLEAMARAGMAAEAAELSALVYGRLQGNPQRDRSTTASLVLSYLEACVRYGQPEMGRKAVADFQRLLTTDVADLGDPEQVRYKFDEKFLRQMVAAFVALDRTDAAAQALQTLLESRMAAAAPELRKRIETAQELLARATGGPGALPVAFVENGGGPELTLWWDVSAMGARGDSWSRAEVSVFGADLQALNGRYAVEILGGDTPTHLTRLAMIPHAPGRGEWHGPAGTNPLSVRFTRVILTGADGATVIGPAVPVDAGEERLGDPEMSEVVKSGTRSAQWTLPEGVLSTTAGPIPGHPALVFVYQGLQGSCELRGARLPVHPGESFVQSAWLRSAGDCRWGLRCFDAQGKALADPAGGELSAPYEAAGWTLVERRFDGPGEIRRDRRERPWRQLPAGTAFIEPVLTLSSNLVTWDARRPVSWAGLSLRSVPPGEGRPAARPERAGDQFGAVETPAPSLAADQESTARNETVFAGFASAARKIALSPEGDMVVVGCQDGTLHFLDYPSGKEVAVLHAHGDPITDLAVLPAKGGVYSVDTRGDTHFVTLEPGGDELVACTAHPPGGAVFSLARKWAIFASDGMRGEPSRDKIRIEVVDLTTGKQVRLIEQPGLFNQLTLSPDEKQFSVRQSGPGSSYVVSSWELPGFVKLPDRTEGRGQPWVSAGSPTRPLFVADPARNRYVMVESTGRFVVRTMNNEILWTFNPALEATSLAVVPKDGVILVCRADGKVWRCVSPK